MAWERGADRTWLVALATAMWGTDALWRQPLATSLPSASVVFWEHVIIVALLAPFLPRAWRALRACGPRERLAMVTVGVGSSALATTLFTTAFQVGDPVTPLVLQKLQPVFAAVASYALLRERLTPRYFAFAVPALVGRGCWRSRTRCTSGSRRWCPRCWRWARPRCGRRGPCSAGT